jgi:hypothetical protein
MDKNIDSELIKKYESDILYEKKKLSLFARLYSLAFINVIIAAILLFIELIWAFIFRFNHDYMTDMQFIKYILKTHTIQIVYILISLGWCQPVLSLLNNHTNIHRRKIGNLENRLDELRGKNL